MPFNAGAIAAKLTLDSSQWSKSVQNVAADQMRLQDMAKGSSGKIDILGKSLDVAALAMKGVTIAGTAVIGFMAASVPAAMKAEKSESALRSALESTGRAVGPLTKHFLDYASELQHSTTFEDDAIQGAQALLLQLTQLDQNGLDAATRGAIGLASVFNMDLQSAARAVAQGMEGNYLALSRLIPSIREAKTEEEKHAAMMDGLARMYQRAEAEANTFGGSLKQLKNSWGDVQEKVGMAIVGNEDIRKAIKSVAEAINELVASGRFSSWLSTITREISATISTIKAWADALKTAGDVARGSWLFEKDMKSGAAAMIAAAKDEIAAFQDELKVFTPSMEKLQGVMEMGPKYWNAWTASVRETDRILDQNRETITRWVGKAVDRYESFIGLDKSAAILGESLKALGIKTRTELTEELANAEAALKLLKGSVESTPGQVKALEDKIASLKEQLTGAKTATVAWVEYLKNIGVTTINEKKNRVAELWKILGDLDKRYKDGRITQDDYAKATKAAKDEIGSLSSELIKNTLPAGRDLHEVLRQAVPRFGDTAYAAWTFEGALKDVADQAMVSEATVLQFLWNTRTEFLSTIGIIVPRWNDIPAGAKSATDETKGLFDGLMNDIASGFGNTIQDWLSGATTFRDFIKGIWEDIKSAFFRVIGQMVAEWTVNFVKKLITDTAEVGKSIAKNISGAIGGAGQAAGSMAGSFLSAASSIANIVTAAASVINLFKKAPTGAGDGMGRVVERQDQQTAILGSIIEFYRNTLGPALLVHGVNYMAKTMDAANAAVGWLQEINGTLSGMKGAYNGAGPLTSPQMVMTHGTPSRPEYVVPEPQMRNAVGGGAGGRQGQPINLTVPVYVGGKKIDERIINVVVNGSQTGGLRRFATKALAGA